MKWGVRLMPADRTPLIIMDASGKALGSISDYTLELSYGDDDCDFALSDINAAVMPVPHGRIGIDGSQYAGVVDTMSVDSAEGKGDSVSFAGRTMQGIAVDAVIMPPEGSTHEVVTGTLSEITKREISRCGLSGVFSVDDCDVRVSGYAFNRFVNLYDGLRMMSGKAGYRPGFYFLDGEFRIKFCPKNAYGTAAGERIYYNFDKAYRPINGIVGLGSGQGVSRLTSIWYASKSGVVSRTQSLFGVDARIVTYQLNSSDQAELDSKAKAKLEELQKKSQADVTLPEDVVLDVGDTVLFSRPEYAIDESLEVLRVVLNAKEGVCSPDCEFGTAEWPEDED